MFEYTDLGACHLLVALPPSSSLVRLTPRPPSRSDLLVLGLEGARQYEAASTISSFLGPAHAPGLTAVQFASDAVLPKGPVVEVSRRVAKSTGKTKVKLSCPALGVRRVDRCQYGCMGVFRAGDEATGVPRRDGDGQQQQQLVALGSGASHDGGDEGEEQGGGACHLGHVKCARAWFRESRCCPVCRSEVVLPDE